MKPNQIPRDCSMLPESRRAELEKRSLLSVNEHFPATSNAESGNSEQALPRGVIEVFIAMSLTLIFASCHSIEILNDQKADAPAKAIKASNKISTYSEWQHNGVFGLESWSVPHEPNKKCKNQWASIKSKESAQAALASTGVTLLTFVPFVQPLAVIAQLGWDPSTVEFSCRGDTNKS